MDAYDIASQVICLQEVHLSTLQNIQRVFPNSEIIASLRPHGKKGGIATIISSAVTVIASTITDYGVAVHICKGTTNVLLVMHTSRELKLHTKHTRRLRAVSFRHPELGTWLTAKGE